MKTLVLNLNFKPLSIVSAHRGLVLSIGNPNLSVLEYYDLSIRSEDDLWEVPAVMMYNKFVKSPKKRIVSKRHILLRDGYECGYCGKFLEKKDRTVDHIIPVSRFKTKGESNTWENLVACCQRCNTHKKNYMPEEVGMALRIKPKRPDGFLMIEEVNNIWRKYIGGSVQDSGLANQT